MAKHSRGNTFVVRIENEHSWVKFCGSIYVASINLIMNVKSSKLFDEKHLQLSKKS